MVDLDWLRFAKTSVKKAGENAAPVYKVRLCFIISGIVLNHFFLFYFLVWHWEKECFFNRAFYHNSRLAKIIYPASKIDQQQWRYPVSHVGWSEDRYFQRNIPLREKCLYSELFWSTFSRIQTRITPNTYTFYVVFVKSLEHQERMVSTLEKLKNFSLEHKPIILWSAHIWISIFTC